MLLNSKSRDKTDENYYFSFLKLLKKIMKKKNTPNVLAKKHSILVIKYYPN